MNKYLILDLKRAFLSWKFPVAVLGVAVTFYVFGQEPTPTRSLIDVYQLNILQFQVLLAYVFSILPYSDALCQDMEKGFYRQMIIRGEVWPYSIAKGISIFVSSACAMIVGNGLYMAILNIRYPEAVWHIEHRLTGAFASIIDMGMYRLYIFLCSLQLGLLVGILGMICALISLYILNRLLILSLPIILYYTLGHMSLLISENYTLGRLYAPWETVNENEAISFLITVGVTLGLFLILQYLIWKKVRGRMRHE